MSPVKKIILALSFLFVYCIAAWAQPARLMITKAELANKIKGGWAGQTIGVTFGGPYEFRFNGTFIGNYQPLIWEKSYLKEQMTNNPGLYDDLYMDLTFVDVFEKHGLNAPVDSFANAFAHAGYFLWHANQAARYNILHGIKAPQSGQFRYNPHADCIDYQIEADFAGLMSPGMPNTASAISDKVGHIMNSGDGWYGGVFVGAMYASAFTSNDIVFVVNNALKTIPANTEFYQCISDVIRWHKAYPTDWKRTWFEVQKKWANDVSCPDGVFAPFNIDAKVNAAYVVIGLLYGGGDFGKTLQIATRCGQDADCNPSTAGGVLGTILGYNKISAYWKQGLREAEYIKFKYTSMSLNDVYAIGLKHALKNIAQNGGTVKGETIKLNVQSPKPVKYEQNFRGIYPREKIPVRLSQAKDAINFEFEGTGFVLRGETAQWDTMTDFTFDTQLYVDGKLVERPQLPVNYVTRRHELCWLYNLPNGRHKVELNILNPDAAYINQLKPTDAIIYTNVTFTAGK